MTPSQSEPVDQEIDGIMNILEQQLGDIWEQYDGDEFQDLEEYSKLYDNAYAEAKTKLNNYFYEKMLEARIDELEQAWDWAIIHNQIYIKPAFILKRIRKLKALFKGEGK